MSASYQVFTTTLTWKRPLAAMCFRAQILRDWNCCLDQDHSGRFATSPIALISPSHLRDQGFDRDQTTEEGLSPLLAAKQPVKHMGLVILASRFTIKGQAEEGWASSG